MGTCVSCGYEYDDEAGFCTYCGTEHSADEQAAAPGRPRAGPTAAPSAGGAEGRAEEPAATVSPVADETAIWGLPARDTDPPVAASALLTAEPAVARRQGRSYTLQIALGLIALLVVAAVGVVLLTQGQDHTSGKLTRKEAEVKELPPPEPVDGVGGLRIPDNSRMLSPRPTARMKVIDGIHVWKAPAKDPALGKPQVLTLGKERIVTCWYYIDSALPLSEWQGSTGYYLVTFRSPDGEPYIGWVHEKLLDVAPPPN